MTRLIVLLLIAGLAGCGEHGDSPTETPAAMDTTKHPDGTINGSVISTDTAAMRVVDSTKN